MSEDINTPEEPTARKSNTWIIVLVVGAVLLLLLCGCLAVAAAGWLRFVPSRIGTNLPWRINGSRGVGRIEATRKVENAFAVETPVLIEVNNKVGSVEFLGTDEKQVRVSALVHAWGSSRQEAQQIAEQVQVQIERRDNGHIYLKGDKLESPRVGQSPTVDWAIYVPRDCKLMVTNGVGEVKIEGIKASGEIKTGVGEINIKDLSLTGDTQVRTEVGKITLTLPKDSAFDLDAATNVGKIQCDFDVSGTHAKILGPNDKLQGQVGNRPAVKLNLRTGTGEVIIRKGR
jgi:hypothetical protein